MMTDTDFLDFLKIQELYKLKTIPRNSSNHYFDEKDNTFYKRRETVAEHVYSCMRLADFFIITEDEFEDLNKPKVYDLIMYHDDIEIETGDVGISDRKKRIDKERKEIKILPSLTKKYPSQLGNKLILLDNEFREKVTPESKFSNGIDRMDALVHEFKYPEDWGPKGFDEKNVREWFQPSFEYSPTFTKYFENIIQYLNTNGYFNVK